MASPNRITDLEVAVASGELVPAQYLPCLPRLPSYSSDSSQEDGSLELPSKEKSPTSFPYDSFLIPKNNQSVSLPKTKRLSRWGKFQLWFNTYRKLFTFVVTINGTGLLLAALDIWHYPRKYTGAPVLGNLLVAIMMRNELLGRLLYLILSTFFAKWPPLWFRLGCTSVLQHLGGIHSGCATSGFAWLTFKVVLVFIDHSAHHDAVLAMGIIANLAVATSVLSAFPWVRNTYHNVFERHHRFAGWTSLACAWLFNVLGDSYDIDQHRWNPDGIRVLRQQDFWFCLGMTVFVLIPWSTVRKVPVEVEIPSPKVAIIRFDRGLQQGLLARISRTAVLEYHAFGAISEGKHAKCHYLICGVQGDFTQKLVDDPPTHLWTRELKFAGSVNSSNIYKRGVLVCTGTGLGSVLSTCIQNRDWFLIWIGSDQQKTFGSTISSLIHRNISPERMCLWDTKERGGRPDGVRLVATIYREWNAEVVFITSNWAGNKELMEGCKKLHIPAFGALWDF